ncbi:MAG: DMT family transporter [Planctomycetota bacterium]|jgi:drug/metabolite transporter (DMT)-like permease
MAARAPDRAFAALVFGALSIAFAPILVRLSELEPTVTAFYRLALAAPLLWLAGARARNEPPAPPKLWWLLLPGLFFAGDLGVWHWSIRFTSVANATLLANFAPVFVTLGGWIVFRRRFGRLFLLGMAIALAGACALMGDSLTLSGDHLLGDALGLLTAVFYGAYILSVGRLREMGIGTVTILAWSTTTAALLLLPVSALARESFVPLTWMGWAVLLGLALVSHIGGQGLIAFALAHLPAAFTSVTLLAQPVLAALLAWLLFEEHLSTLQVLGALVILAGILLARRASDRPTPAP